MTSDDANASRLPLIRALSRAWAALLLGAALIAGCGVREASPVFERPVAAVYSAGLDRVFLLELGRPVEGHPVDAVAPPRTASISRLTADGRVEQRHWLRGFSADAVLAVNGDSLYVADGNRLWQFDAHSGEVLEQRDFDGAHLTDLAVDGSGLIHVLDRAGGHVLRIAGGRVTPVPLPGATTPIAVLSTADALWILARDPLARTTLVRHRYGESDRQCELGEVGPQSVLLGLDHRHIGLFDPDTQKLQRWDHECRPLLNWRIAADAVRPALLPADRLAVPQPRQGRVEVQPTPNQLLADNPGAY